MSWAADRALEDTPREPAKDATRWLTLAANWNQESRYIELITELGDGARSLPVDLWAWCANNATTGDVSKYSSQALAYSLRYTTGDHVQMLTALKKHKYLTKGGQVVGWLDRIFKLAKAYIKKAEKAGKKSAEVRLKPAPLSDSPRPEKAEENQSRGREEDHAEPEAHSETPPPTGFSVLVLSDAERSDIEQQFCITAAESVSALRIYNEIKSNFDQPTSAQKFAGWLRTTKEGKAARCAKSQFAGAF